jgi:tRNA threonylcarbamoyladenosine biosynthesis protein TsaE
MPQVTISRIEDWQPLAARLIRDVSERVSPETEAGVIILTGDLGAGKTTLTQVIARELGVTESVQSPTFTIMRRYATKHPVFKELVHMDAYRIETLDELAPLRFKEMLAMPNTLICIEWGERIETALPDHTIHLSINHQLDDLRLVTIEER